MFRKRREEEEKKKKRTKKILQSLSRQLKFSSALMKPVSDVISTCNLSNLKEITLKGDLQKTHFKNRLNKRKQKPYFHQKLFYKWTNTF